MSEKGIVTGIASLVKEIPVYQDALQPGMKEIGKGLRTVAKTINFALCPLKALVWGYEKIEIFLNEFLSKKLENTPIENIQTPPAHIAVPAIEALRYTGEDKNLRELYANLIANSMDVKNTDKAHPSFVEIIKNLSSDEALFLRVFLKEDKYPLIDLKSMNIDGNGYTVHIENYSHLDRLIKLRRPDLIFVYINNLCRLGILEIPSGIYFNDDKFYNSFENDSNLKSQKDNIKLIGKKVGIDKKLVRTTSFGKQFISNVVSYKS